MDHLVIICDSIHTYAITKWTFTKLFVEAKIAYWNNGLLFWFIQVVIMVLKLFLVTAHIEEPLDWYLTFSRILPITENVV